MRKFKNYGLNKFRNFLKAPPCDCGCGGKAQPVLHSTKELFHFCYEMLAYNECCQCAIFAHGNDGKMWAIVKLDEVDLDIEYDTEECPVKFFGIEEYDPDFFSKFDAEFELHCYGLMIQDKDVWRIVEE